MIKKKLVEEENLNEAQDPNTLGAAIDAAEKVLGDPEVYSGAGDIETALDEALEANLLEIESGGRDFQNVLFVGAAGTGKTSRIRAWAQKHGINLVKVIAATMDETDLSGVITPNLEKGVASKLATAEFDELGDVEKSVLFLDEWNRAPRSVRATLLNLIQDHEIPDPRVKGHMRFLPNFLFTVAAVNPATGDYNTDELDPAELGRVREIEVVNDPKGWLDYIRHVLGRKIKFFEDKGNEKAAKRFKGQLAIIEKLLTDPRGKTLFDSVDDMEKSLEDKQTNKGNGKFVNSRNMTNLLNGCNGTKDDFLNKWNGYCNSNKKQTAVEILKDYKDVDDKANAALSDGTDSEIFSSKKAKVNNLKDLINKNI